VRRSARHSAKHSARHSAKHKASHMCIYLQSSIEYVLILKFSQSYYARMHPFSHVSRMKPDANAILFPDLSQSTRAWLKCFKSTILARWCYVAVGRMLASAESMTSACILYVTLQLVSASSLNGVLLVAGFPTVCPDYSLSGPDIVAPSRA
jgi:hypothetical protein